GQGPRRALFADRTDEAHALALHGADQSLLFSAVTDRLARGIDSARERRLGDDPAAPHRRDQIVLAHHAIGIAHEMDEQIEHLRRDRDGFAAAQQLASVGVENVIGKKKLHSCPDPATCPKAVAKGKSAPFKHKSSVWQSLSWPFRVFPEPRSR